MKHIKGSHKSHVSGTTRSFRSFAKRLIKLNWKEDWEKRMYNKYATIPNQSKGN